MRTPHRPRLARSARPLAAAVLLGAPLGAVPTCDETESPTATTTRALTEEASEVTTLGTIPLPIQQSVASSSVAFGITQTGTGINGPFLINNASNANAALYAVTGGTGRAGEFIVNNALNLSPALSASTDGYGPAGAFTISNASSAQAAVRATTSGTGPALTATHAGTGSEAGKFAITNRGNSRAALYAQTVGTGPAGSFQGTSYGVLIVVNSGGKGLQVLNGTKQAVVSTPSGARSLYTEEATEVWFADYGFARLADGRVRVALDPTFAQTVNVEEPYHVFVQPYGDAELVVRERTPAGFLVVLRAGSERDAEFSYRVVAKRRDFERARLEPAPWVDGTVRSVPPGR